MLHAAPDAAAQPPRRERLINARRIVAVASGKGGVGKSTIAVNLAVALAQRGLRVGLFDADLHGPDVPLMLGVRRRQAAEGWEALLPVGSGAGVAPRLARLEPLERHGVKIMSLGLLIGEEQAALVDNAAFAGLLARQLLASVNWGALDALFIDFPPGAGEPLATLLATTRLDGVVLVVTPQDLALLDTSRALDAFRRAEAPLTGVVENMSYLACPACGERVQVFHRSRVPRAVTASDLPLLAEIPIEPAISAAADSGRPVLVADPDGAHAAHFHRLAAAVAGRLGLELPANGAG